MTAEIPEYSHARPALASDEITPGRYRHFKGKDYQVVGIARDSETMRSMVVYRALYGDGGLWVRPLEMFAETVERDGVVQPRFQLIEPSRE